MFTRLYKDKSTNYFHFFFKKKFQKNGISVIHFILLTFIKKGYVYKY